MSVTLEQAQAARDSGKSLYGWVAEHLGITDKNAQRRAVNELGALLVQTEHPEFDQLAEQFRDKGFTVEVEYIADAVVHISVMNYPERVDTTSTFGSYGVGLTGKYLGRVTARAYRQGFTYEYHGWNGAMVKRRYNKEHHTSKWSVVLKQFPIDARVPTESDYERLFAARAERKALTSSWDRRRELEQLMIDNGRAAFEILLRSNVVLPDDFKQVMSRYMDLTEGLLK